MNSVEFSNFVPPASSRKKSFHESPGSSLEGKQVPIVSVSEKAKDMLVIEELNSVAKTSLSLKKDGNRMVYEFFDKRTGDKIKQVPSESDLVNIDRIQKFLSRVTEDLVLGNEDSKIPKL